MVIVTTTLTIPIEVPADMAESLGFGSEEQMATDFRVTLAVRLFEEGRVSLGRAAQIAGMHRIPFMEELSRRKVSVFNWDDEETRREFSKWNG
jgi:predicted HTH domain antitoxin